MENTKESINFEIDAYDTLSHEIGKYPLMKDKFDNYEQLNLVSTRLKHVLLQVGSKYQQVGEYSDLNDSLLRNVLTCFHFIQDGYQETLLYKFMEEEKDEKDYMNRMEVIRQITTETRKNERGFLCCGGRKRESEVYTMETEYQKLYDENHHDDRQTQSLTFKELIMAIFSYSSHSKSIRHLCLSLLCRIQNPLGEFIRYIDKGVSIQDSKYDQVLQTQKQLYQL